MTLWKSTFQAHLLFDEAELRAMAESLEQRALEAKQGGPIAVSALGDRVPWYQKAPARGMQEIAEALRDPNLYARATRLQHPNVSDLQLDEMARFHLECGDAAGALKILESPWEGGRETVRLDLLDRAYGQLGDQASQIAVRRQRYEHLPCLWTFRALEELLDDAAREELHAQVLRDAGKFTFLSTAVQMLFAIGAYAYAQVVVVARAKEFEMGGASGLEDLAKEAEERGFPLMAAIICRALLNPILERGRDVSIELLANQLRDISASSICASDTTSSHTAFPGKLTPEIALNPGQCGAPAVLIPLFGPSHHSQ